MDYKTCKYLSGIILDDILKCWMLDFSIASNIMPLGYLNVL